MSTATTAPAAMAQKRGGAFGALVDNERWLMRAMLAPAIIYIVLLVGVPFLLSLYYSLSSVTIASRDMHLSRPGELPARHGKPHLLAGA